MLQGFFSGDQQPLTPEQVERLRNSSAAAALAGADTTPVAHWSAGLARVVDALGGYRGNIRADKAEEAGLAGADEAIRGNPIIASLLGGDQAGMAQPSPVASALAATPQAPSFGADGSVIRQGLVERGLPEHVADAFVMNFQDESGLNPGINEQNPLVAGSRGGFGLAQWTGPRRKQLEAFAAQRGVPVSDANLQMDFLMQELQGSERGAAQSILSAQDAPTAAAAIVNKFLRPAEEHRARREASYLGGAAPSPASQPSSAPNGVVAALAQAQGNPWVQQKYGGVIEALMGQQMNRDNAAYQQQLRQQDPMYQAQLQQAQLQLEQMRQPAAVEYGWQTMPDGTLVRTDSTGNITPMGQYAKPEGVPTPTDDMREYEVARSQGYEGTLQDWILSQKKAGAATNTVTIGGGNDLRKKLSEREGEQWGTALDAGARAGATMQDMAMLEELSAIAPQGPIQGRLAQAFPGMNSAADAMNSIISRVAPTLREPGSGSTSDIEYEGMLKSLPNLRNKPEANRAIIGMMRAKAQIQTERAATVADYQNGLIDEQTARSKMQELANRSIMTPDMKAIIGQTSGSDAQGVPAGVDPADWEFMTPEERALFQ